MIGAPLSNLGRYWPAYHRETVGEEGKDVVIKVPAAEAEAVAAKPSIRDVSTAILVDLVDDRRPTRRRR